MVLIYFPAFMKQSKKEEQQPDSFEDNQLLEHLRNENNVLNKLIRQLEKRDPSKPKPEDAHKTEGDIPDSVRFDESSSE